MARKRKSPEEEELEQGTKKLPYLKGIADRKLKRELRSKELIYAKSALVAEKLEQWLLPSEGGVLEPDNGERTCDYSQQEIVNAVDISSSHKAFDLKLPDLGPYTLDYTHNGRFALFGGRKGHLALLDWKTSYLITETQVRETTRDVKFLHNEQFFAAAQKKYIYIYDKKGAEVHCLKEHEFPLKLEFLRHHFLLASINKAGVLHYQDTSTGKIVADHQTKLGRCEVIRANPFNAVLGLGHSNGTVTMWTPNMSTPLVQLLCHRGPVKALGFDSGGRYIVSAGADAKIKIWDLRTLKPLNSYVSFNAIASVDVSQKGLLAVGSGSMVEIWRDVFGAAKQEKPYMKHKLKHLTSVQDLSFCPFEDVLGIGHSDGVSSILVPGSGEPNFDSFAANPFESAKQRHEGEVHALLDKLQPEMIMMDPHQLGAVKKAPKVKQQVEEEEPEQAEEKPAKRIKEKRKMKGKNKVGKRVGKKREQAFKIKKARIRDQHGQHQAPVKNKVMNEAPLSRALARFAVNA